MLSDVHIVFAVGVLASNALVAAWGTAAWLRREPSVWFWYLLRSAQVVVGVQVVLGLLLLGQDRQPPDELHYVYGIAPLVVTFFSEGMRVGAAQRELDDVEDLDALTRQEQAALARRVVLREMGVMTIGALLIVTLALRAAASGGGLL